MPYPNEHAARIKNPDGYERVRRENDKFAAGIDAIWGVLQDGTVELQAIRFDSSRYTVDQAKTWLADHDIKTILFEEASGKEKAGRACPRCGSTDVSFVEVHPDTDMNDVVLRCKACGFDEEKDTVKRFVPIISVAKAGEEDSGFVLAPVLVPDEEDEQGDIVDAAEIEKAAHDFMAEYETVGIQHARPLADRDAVVVESYIQRGAGNVAGVDIKPGTWVLGIRLRSKELREAVKAGQLTGLSIGGAASRVEEV
jgi:hypothetical protein